MLRLIVARSSRSASFLPRNQNIFLISRCFSSNPPPLIDDSSSSSGDHSSLETEYKPEIDYLLKKYAHNQATKQKLTGVVVSDKCSKSISVQVQHYKYIAKYNKSLQVRKKIMAHDEEELASLGDIVTIVPSRPMSRKKRHKLLEIVRKYRNIDDVVITPPTNSTESNDNNQKTKETFINDSRV